MNLHTKLITLTLLISTLFSCSSSDDLYSPENNNIPAMTQFDNPSAPAFLNITMVPSGDVCTSQFIVNAEIMNEKGYSHSTTLSAENGVVAIHLDDEFSYGAYSIVFSNVTTGEIYGSTSFYLTTEDLNSDYYSKTIEYNNCNL